MHFDSEPALANLRVSGFLQAAKALRFFAAGATPDKSVVFLYTTTSSTAATTAAGFDDEDFFAAVGVAAAGLAGAAAAVRDGRVRGPARFQ